jgi:hypothetical protein
LNKLNFADTSVAVDRPQNNLLRALRPADYALLAPSLEMVEYPARHLLYNPGDHVGTVYFPCGPSLVSYLVSNEDGRDVETMLVGREGAVGGIVSHGNLPAYTRMLVQFGGPFAHLRLDLLEAAKSRSPGLNGMFARYADCMLAQMVQSAACNATHAIEQRTAKWIISAMERTGSAIVPLTQEQLAAMLGVGRSYASRVIQAFRRDGLLQTRRGALLVTNADALAARACMCNEQVKGHFATVLSGVYPTDH